MAVSANVRVSFVFFAVALFLFIIWIYLILKTDRKKKLSGIELQKCLCPICKHEGTNDCVKQKCPCCVDMKDNSVVGHTVD